MAFSVSQIYVAPHWRSGAAFVLEAVEKRLEQERERLALWVPIALGVGIVAWFALPDSRGWMGWIGGCGGVALAALGLPQGGRLRLMVASGALLAAVGCVLIWGKALTVGERPLARPVFASVEGRVIAVERQPALERVRLTVEPIKASAALPAHIRVTLMDRDRVEGIGKGAIISFRSRLMPPPPAAVPGAYDFAARAYFMGVGAAGRVLPPVQVMQAAPQGGDGLRQRLGDHVRSRLEGAEGAIAATLATGDRGAISETDAEAMRRSGLAHLLAISGLHVSALIGAVMLIVYRLLALSPRLALGMPLMLIAAGAGALAGIGYTLLTGGEVPTVRACIAALLVLGALALGREPISLRLIAAGATAVLLIWPEALVGASFQMSFAAVTVIVALAESRWFRHLTLARDEGRAMKVVRATGALFLTGLAVEIALTPVALYHFHQAGILGALANLIAIPLTTFVIMPAEALALALDVVGLGGPFWWITGKALSLLLLVAHKIAAHPLAVWALPTFSPVSFVVLILGGAWLVIWSTGMRWWGLVPVIGGAVAMAAMPAPDLLVTGDGRHIAVPLADGRIALLRTRAGDYVRDMLGTVAGEGEAERSMIAIEDAPGARCSRDLCAIRVVDGGRHWDIVATRSTMRVPYVALIKACVRADIVVSDRRLPKACKPRWLKLDRAHLRRTGGMAIYLGRKTWRSVRGDGDRHPWVIAK
ncbi:MAG: ComEC/Rec2 family competence protein [Sphingobium sp.]